MNWHQPITPQNAPRVAATGLLLLTLLFGVRLAGERVSAQREQRRTIQHMNLEMGRGPDADTSHVPESQPGEGDPNFVW